MPKRRPGVEQPAVTVVEIDDPTSAGQGIEVIDLDAVQLASTPFRATRVVVRLDRVTVVYLTTNHRVRTRTKAQQGLLAFVAFGPRTRGTVNGLPIRPGLMLAAETARETLAWLDTVPEDKREQYRSSGIKKDREAKILAEWRARK